jgi:cell division transport system ATP-binding protein
MIKFDHVSKSFGTVTALQDASFEIGDGEFVFLIGPSGAGKTTIVNLLLRSFTPTSGEVSVSDVDLIKLDKKKIAEYRRHLGIIFQDFKLISHLNVFENVAIALRVMGTKEALLKLEVEQALELVGLADRSEDFPSQLSGGEVQRVCIARAIVGNPEIILADEPTGNLDLETAKQIVSYLKKINELGKIVIMATHNFEIVNCMKERVIKIEKGTVTHDDKKGKYKF